MIKYLSIILLTVLNCSIAVAQFETKKAKSCTEKSELRKKNVRYAEWECGKSAGTVDCNEKLSFDQITETFTAGIDGTPYNGKCETCHNNGMLERTVSFVNGKEDGYDTTKYATGCIQVIRSHIQGIRNGQWLYYYDTVQTLAWEMNYFAGEQHGKTIRFMKNGDTVLYENYKNGLQHGVQKTYFFKNVLQKQINYKDGYLDGAYMIYNEKSVVIQNLNYVSGKKDGEQKYFYDDGVVLRTENWKLDVKEGEFKTFYYEGHIQDHETYKKGKREGLAEEFYPDSKLKHKTIYKKGIVIQEYKYDEQGRETYAFGRPVGKDGEAEDDSVMSGQSGSKKKKKKKK
jgi:antitoxin component YwqK of YwqJK toxin-antitoxin module